MAFVLGIDKGTSVVKAVVFDQDGHVQGQGEERVAVLAPRPGWHEEDPEASWGACCRTIRSALSDAGIGGADVAGVGIAAHMGGAWIVDASGRPLRNAICWPDERAGDDLTELKEADLLDAAFAISGNGLMPGITLLILRWLSRHEPGLRAEAAAVLSAKDYLRLRLTGEVATDPSDVSFVPGDIDRRAHSAELLALMGVDDWAGAMPPILPSDAIAGAVTAEAAAATGLAEGTPVVTGLGDAVANLLGAGRSAPGDAVTVLGTSCLNSTVLDGPGRAPEGLGFLFAMPEERYVRILPNTSGTITLDWFLDQFGGPRRPDGSWDFEALGTEVAAMRRGAEGVILVPYLNPAGVLAPVYDPQARGAFFGMSSQTSSAHLMRAIYEALAFSTRDCFAAMPGTRASLTLTGGGARSPVWAQMFADICGLPIQACTTDQTGALGVALLAGVATGVWPDLATAQARAVSIAATYTPDAEAQADYDGWFELYRDCCAVYRDMSHARSDLMATATSVEGAPA